MPSQKSCHTHQSVNDGSYCSVEHVKPGDLLSDIRKASEWEIGHTDRPFWAAGAACTEQHGQK